MKKNIIGSVFFLAFSCFYFYNVSNIKTMPGSQFSVMTASTFPFYIGIVGILVSLALLVITILDKNDKDYLTISFLKTLDFKKAISFILLMIFYGFTMRSLGFVLATMIFLAVGFFILKERNLKRIFLISTTVPIVFDLLLNNLLGVYIDPGMVFDFLAGGAS